MRRSLQTLVSSICIAGGLAALVPACSDDATPSPSEPIRTTATPDFDPSPGDYREPREISIRSVSPGAVVRYTTDGSDPTPSSALYQSPVRLDRPATLRARAWVAGWLPSPIRSGDYVIALGTVEEPTFDPAPGPFRPEGTTVEISCATPGVSIHYTTDGTQPTQDSPRYSGPISISASTTLGARAWREGWNPSAYAWGDFEITPNVLWHRTSVWTAVGTAGIALHGDHVFLASDRGYVTYDVSNPLAPERVGVLERPFSRRLDMERSGDHLYAMADDARIEVVSIVNPRRPTLVNTVDLREFGPLNEITDLEVDDAVLVASTYRGLLFLDVTDPTSPTVLGPPLIPEPIGLGVSLDTDRDLAFLRTFSHLSVLDYRDPARPTLLRTRRFENLTPNDTHVDPDTGHLLVSSPSGLTIFDVTDPTQPTPIGHYDHQAQLGSNLAVAAGHAILAHVNRSPTVVDVRNPTDPHFVQSLFGDPSLGTHRVVVSGSYLFGSAWTRLLVFELDNLPE